MSEPWDAEDLAIARALDAAPETRDPGCRSGARRHLPRGTCAVAVAHRGGAARARGSDRRSRAPAAPRGRARARRRTGARDRRTRRVRLVALATTAVAAAIIVGLIVVAGGSGSSAPSGHVTLATAHGADIDALLRAPGTRTGAFGTTPAASPSVATGTASSSTSRAPIP